MYVGVDIFLEIKPSGCVVRGVLPILKNNGVIIPRIGRLVSVLHRKVCGLGIPRYISGVGGVNRNAVSIIVTRNALSYSTYLGGTAFSLVINAS